MLAPAFCFPTPNRTRDVKKRKRKPLPPVKRLRELLNYNPDTGVLTWRVQRRSIKPGSVAGAVGKWGYRDVTVEGVSYKAHRIIFKIMTGRDPVNDIDHKDLNRDNNAWANLREATRSQNHMNRRCAAGSETGLKGASFARNHTGKWSGKYQAQLQTHRLEVPWRIQYRRGSTSCLVGGGAEGLR